MDKARIFYRLHIYQIRDRPTRLRFSTQEQFHLQSPSPGTLTLKVDKKITRQTFLSSTQLPELRGIFHSSPEQFIIQSLRPGTLQGLRDRGKQGLATHQQQGASERFQEVTSPTLSPPLLGNTGSCLRRRCRLVKIQAPAASMPTHTLAAGNTETKE